jgi:hypothetical protein
MMTAESDIVAMALDQSPNNTGWAIGCPFSTRPLYGKFDLPPWGTDEPKRVHAAFVWLQSMVEQHRVTHIFYELDVPRAGLGKAIMSRPKRGVSRPIVINQKDPAITRNQNALIAVIWLVAAINGIPVAPIDVLDMRERFVGTRHITGLHGDALTREWKNMALKACSMRGWIVSDHNVAEALGHLDYAHSVINRKHAGSRDILARRSELQFWNGERS